MARRKQVAPHRAVAMDAVMVKVSDADAVSFEPARKQRLRDLIERRNKKKAGGERLKQKEEQAVAFREQLDGGWYYCKAVQGPREYMEDEFEAQIPMSRVTTSDGSDKICTGAKGDKLPRRLTRLSSKSNAADGLDVSLFGIFDGHGGELCSRFLREEMFSVLRAHKSFPKDIPTALKAAFTTVDAIVCAISRETEDTFQDGSTATVAVLDHAKQELWVANAGDSRSAIVSNDGTTEPLTRDHSCALADESKRIVEMGGQVINCDGIKRVQGILAVSRAIGDPCLKPFVTSVPEVKRIDLSNGSFKFFCIGSDGIWDEVNEFEVGRELLANGVKRGVQTIVQLANERGSEDNMTFMAIALSGAGGVSGEAPAVTDNTKRATSSPSSSQTAKRRKR